MLKGQQLTFYLFCRISSAVPKGEIDGCQIKDSKLVVRNEFRRLHL